MISVIVPVYMTESYLPKCIESIINQTYRKLEIILVDDGSLDRCGEICDEYAKSDKRIVVFHTQNRGLSAARNYGIERANGQYIGFVDSDDWIEPNMFEMLLETLEESKSEIVQCAYYEENGLVKKIVAPVAKTYTSTEALHALLQGKICSGVWSKLWRKECFSEIKFPEGRVFEDTATTYKLFSTICFVTAITNVLYHYVTRENSITNSHSMANLADFWSAHQERYEFFLNDERFNKNDFYMNKLLLNCGVAIARTMCWVYAVPLEERERYSFQINEMHNFAKVYLQNQSRKDWPLYLRFCLFLGKLNSSLSLSFLYYANQFYRKLKLFNNT